MTHSAYRYILLVYPVNWRRRDGSLARGLGSDGIGQRTTRILHRWVGVLTLVINWGVGLRPWQLTLWFIISLLAGYLIITLLELSTRALFITAAFRWRDLITQLEQVIVHRIQETQSRQIALSGPSMYPYIAPAMTRQMIEMLSLEKGDLRIFSAMGDPRSYQFAETLRIGFSQGGWQVEHAPTAIASALVGLRLVVSNVNDMPQSASSVARALSQISVAFTVDSNASKVFKDWCLYVGRS
jgi:hypothetical protein